MKGSTNPLGGIPCPGCPIYPHIPDEQFRFPSCELCHWPAIGIGSRHVWRCAYCRHWNEHGLLRPRVSAVLLRLESISPAARRLDVVDPRYGRYLIPQARHSPYQPRTPHRPEIPGLSGTSRWPGGRSGTGLGGVAHGGDAGLGASRGGGSDGGVAHGSGTGRPGAAGGGGWARGAERERAGRTVWARAAVAGLPVLIVGGDRPYAYPLGLAEQDPEPCSFGSRATRIACPCDQPPPCVHGQALYAHVVSPAAPPAPAGQALSAVALSRSAC